MTAATDWGRVMADLTDPSDHVTDVRPVPTTMDDLITFEWWAARNDRDQWEAGFKVMDNAS